MCVLAEVVTVPEVCLMWGVHISSVRWRLDRGAFRWRYTAGGHVLIDKASVVAVWGPPRCNDISVRDVIDMVR